MTGGVPLTTASQASHKFTEIEEEVIVRRILDMNARVFSPRMTNIEEWADTILATRGGTPAGKHWLNRFIDRPPNLKTRFYRVYDYQRALCEDPKKLEA